MRMFLSRVCLRRAQQTANDARCPHHSGHKGVSMEMSAAQFKTRCLALIDQVAQTREEIVITKRGKPVAKLVPVDYTLTHSTFGEQAGMGEITIAPTAETPHA